MALKTPNFIHSSRRSRGRVGDHTSAEALRVLPGASGDEPDEHHLEAVPVRGPLAMTTERVVQLTHRDERLDTSPDHIDHFGVEYAHDGGDLHLVVGSVTAPQVSWGQNNDRWMIFLRAIYVRTTWSGACRPIRAAS